MEDLENNPLYRLFLTKFRKEFEIACKLSYLIVIPHANLLDNIQIDKFLANSHILIPSNLLKQHYTPLQPGYCDNIELDGKSLILNWTKRSRDNVGSVKVNILGQEVGYNSSNKEYRIFIIDKLLLNQPNKRSQLRNLFSPLSSPKSSSLLLQASSKIKPSKPLTNHDDCSKYLEFLSPKLSVDLENSVKLLQTNYLILPQYLDDAAHRIKNLVDVYVVKFENSILNATSIVCDSVKQAIRLSVENYVVHLMHGKLMVPIYGLCEKEDTILIDNLNEIRNSKVSTSELGAQSAFSGLVLSDDILHLLKRLPYQQSPLALVTSLIKLKDLINNCLNQTIKIKILLGDVSCSEGKVSICSDDLIASLVLAMAEAKPIHLYSICKYLEMFGWTSSACDQAAYYTATFQIVIHYILNYIHGNEEATTSGSNSTLSINDRAPSKGEESISPGIVTMVDSVNEAGFDNTLDLDLVMSLPPSTNRDLNKLSTSINGTGGDWELV